MPSDGDALTGQCYCGHVRLTSSEPLIVTYCHCADCKRWTGAPLPAFAAVRQVTLSPDIAEVRFPSGAARRNCPKCGSPLAARFSYLDGQTYLPLGIVDQAEDLPPSLHCHADQAFAWLHLSDDLPREGGSGRETLGAAS